MVSKELIHLEVNNDSMITMIFSKKNKYMLI